MSDDQQLKLPENAYRELADGEQYTPVLGQEKGILEITLRSIVIGFGMAVFRHSRSSRLERSRVAAFPASSISIRVLETRLPSASLTIRSTDE